MLSPCWPATFAAASVWHGHPYRLCGTPRLPAYFSQAASMVVHVDDFAFIVAGSEYVSRHCCRLVPSAH
uniref:hypothetical protein n=1 Tax=Paraburkholderia sp. J41 TaxID=2805433 RepID=UPI002AC33F63